MLLHATRRSLQFKREVKKTSMANTVYSGVPYKDIPKLQILRGYFLIYHDVPLMLIRLFYYTFLNLDI